MRDSISEQKVKKLATRFKTLRMEQCLSQAALAQQIGMSDRAISMIERHKRIPTVLTCFKIAQALGVPLHDILRDI